MDGRESCQLKAVCSSRELNMVTCCMTYMYVSGCRICVCIGDSVIRTTTSRSNLVIVLLRTVTFGDHSAQLSHQCSQKYPEVHSSNQFPQLSLSVYVVREISLSLCLSVCLSPSLSFSLSLALSVCVRVCERERERERMTAH